MTGDGIRVLVRDNPCASTDVEKEGTREIRKKREETTEQGVELTGRNYFSGDLTPRLYEFVLPRDA